MNLVLTRAILLRLRCVQLSWRGLAEELCGR